MRREHELARLGCSLPRYQGPDREERTRDESPKSGDRIVNGMG